MKVLTALATLVLAAALVPTALAMRPDDRVGTRGPGPVLSAVRPDDRAGIHGPGASESAVVQPAAGSFDWSDAFIGSLGGAGIALLLMGVLFVATSRRSRTSIA